MPNCLKCKKAFIKYNEEDCKECYEKKMMQVQSMNLAVLALRKYNSDHEDYPSKLFEMAKRIYKESKNHKYSSEGWEK